MLSYKIVTNNKSDVCVTSVQYYLHTILLWYVYYVNWCCHLKNNKKKGAFDLFTCVIFSGYQLANYCIFFQKLRQLSQNYSNFIYIFLKLKLGTPKCICLKWVFLSKWIINWPPCPCILRIACGYLLHSLIFPHYSKIQRF